jgi:hypothetical protein
MCSETTSPINSGRSLRTYSFVNASISSSPKVATSMESLGALNLRDTLRTASHESVITCASGDCPFPATVKCVSCVHKYCSHHISKANASPTCMYCVEIQTNSAGRKH